MTAALALPTPEYVALAARLRSEHFIDDAWVDGQPRFAPDPVLLSAPTADRLADAAEAVAAVLDEMCRIVAAEPTLLESFFRLTPVQRLRIPAAPGRRFRRHLGRDSGMTRAQIPAAPGR